MSNRLFQLKGSSFTLTVLELYSTNLEAFDQFLRQKILQAPLFFRSTPVVIDVQKLSGGFLDLREIIERLKTNGLAPIALRGGDASIQATAVEMGLGVLSNQRRIEELPEKTNEPEPPAVQTASSTRVVTKPIRSGQRVYAEGGDLLVLSSVSVGAEIIADGHIHVYGPLRGRALAGVSGNTDARIFCTHLESELVSVAGYYKLSEQLKTAPCWKERAHVFLDDKNLRIEPLS